MYPDPKRQGLWHGTPDPTFFNPVDVTVLRDFPGENVKAFDTVQMSIMPGGKVYLIGHGGGCFCTNAIKGVDFA